MKAKSGVITKTLEEMLKIGVVFMILITVVIMAIACFDSDNEGEADTGSFSSWDYNSGWVMEADGTREDMTLPDSFDTELYGDTVDLVNRLPSGLSDGMNLMIRASMEDIYIYIGDELRTEYSSDTISRRAYYVPSAYVVCPLNEEDSGEPIRITVRAKTRGVLNGVTIGYGNNVWYSVIGRGLAVNLTAGTVLVLGVLLTILVMMAGSSVNKASARYLGLLMIDVSLWIFSESILRQIIFNRPSLSNIFAFFTVEMIGVIACMYFDEVQHRVYHTRYLIAETISFAQIMINILLFATGVCELYQTLFISHFWTGLCAVLALTCIVTDIFTGRIKAYRISAIGMIGFMVLSLSELAGFYINRFHIFGAYLCLGLIFLMVATIVQILSDVTADYERRRREQTDMTIHAIETIASAIDARDEYTGGHSERVGFYAGRLAREMAADYDFSEEDILRIQYIGLVHDIGKIGVADNVLNKAGRLDDEEFMLMKKHPSIGYEIMSSMGGIIDGLLDGIRYHHERFDGRGYPDGLSDTDIPLTARILALADSFDAMTSNRVYRKRLSDEEVRAELIKCSGTQFDPALTEIFLRLLDRGELATHTTEGIALESDGRMLVSSILESRLQQDLLDKVDVLNPSHVRMLCYIIKLMEKKGDTYKILFAGIKGDEEYRALGEFLKSKMDSHDTCIRYTEEIYVAALYNKSDGDDRVLSAAISKAVPGATIDFLREVNGDGSF